VNDYTRDFGEIGLDDLPRVGGKNASLGQLFNALGSKGEAVLDGFATTTEAYRRLLEDNGLESGPRTVFTDFDPENLAQLEERGQAARAAVLAIPWPWRAFAI
jgi:pyruvate,water dikinase